MNMQQYVKGDKVIQATPTAFKAIYEAQGFVPAPNAPAKKPNPPKGAAEDGQDGSNTGDHAKSPAAGKRTRAKS